MSELTYKSIVENDLRKLNKWRFALVQIQSELETINAEYAAIKATNYDKMPGGSGDNIQEEKLITAIVKKGQKEAEYELNSRKIADMERLLTQLPTDERRVVECMVVNKGQYSVDRLADELGYERAQIYRKKDRALRTMAQLRYGAAYQP